MTKGHMSKTLLLCAVLAMSLTLLPTVEAQVERASLIGSVTDKTGAAIANVTVTVTNEATNTSVKLVTDQSGAYTAVNLIPGSYSVAASAAGFRTVTYRNFVLQVSQQARLDLSMEVGELQQSIEVTGSAPLLQTENASVGQVIGAQAVNELPLNGRNFVQLAILAPGVTGLDYAQPATINGGGRPDELRPGGTTLQANGAGTYSNQVLLDGIDDTEMVSHTFVVRPSVEGIQEFKVLTNNPGAEYGRASGAVAVLTTRSGGNQVHGALFEFLRNDKLDSWNFFANRNATKPPYKLNQYGGSLGGPVVLPRYNGKDKTFFFVDYEGFREVTGQPQVVTVPTAATRAGNFQGVTANGIFDPLTTRANPAGGAAIRDPFPNNVIQPTRFDPIGSALAQLYPLPQTSALVNNYITTPIKRSNSHRGDARIDHQLSPKDTLFFRYSVDSSSIENPETFNKNIGGNEGSFSGQDDVRGHSLVAAWTRAISARTIGDFRFGYTQFHMGLVPNALSNPVWAKIPGRLASDPWQPTAPIVSPSGYAGLGNPRSAPLIRDEDMKEAIANFSNLHGNHSIKFGVDFRFRGSGETASPPGESAFGRWNFDPAYTRNPASPTGTGDAMAAMILGYPIALRRDMFLAQQAFLHTKEYNFYVKDDWRITRTLTLNLGFHYELNTPFTEIDNKWASFNPVTAQQLIAGQNGVSRSANINTDYKGIGPRIAFAWQATQKTVLRGGYGLFYDPQGNADTNIRQMRQPPFDFVLNIPQSGNDVPTLVTSAGFPVATTAPDLTKGTVAMYALKGVTPNYRNAQIQQFNLSLQRELTNTTVLTVGFVSAAGAHLYWARNLNLPLPGPGSIDPRRPYYNVLPSVSGITWLESSGNSFFSSMQTSFEKRLSSGFYLLSNWTWSHSLDNYAANGGIPGPTPQDPRNRRADWASSNNDLRHKVNIAATYQLPFGPGKPYATGNNIASYLVRGWELGGIAVMQSGLPFTVTVSGSPSNTGNGSRANPVAGVSPIPASQTISQWFNPAAFTTPPAYTWGTVSRDSLNGPPLYNLDSSISRKFKFSEQKELTFRWQMFNAMNHPQFGLPNATVGVGGAGTITSTQRSNRQMQFALRLAF
jgi:hypothetical protein